MVTVLTQELQNGYKQSIRPFSVAVNPFFRTFPGKKSRAVAQTPSEQGRLRIGEAFFPDGACPKGENVIKCPAKPIKDRIEIGDP
jgi:hypothetical protein